MDPYYIHHSQRYVAISSRQNHHISNNHPQNPNLYSTHYLLQPPQPSQQVALPPPPQHPQLYSLSPTPQLRLQQKHPYDPRNVPYNSHTDHREIHHPISRQSSHVQYRDTPHSRTPEFDGVNRHNMPGASGTAESRVYSLPHVLRAGTNMDHNHHHFDERAVSQNWHNDRFRRSLDDNSRTRVELDVKTIGNSLKDECCSLGQFVSDSDRSFRDAEVIMRGYESNLGHHDKRYCSEFDHEVTTSIAIDGTSENLRWPNDTQHSPVQREVDYPSSEADNYNYNDDKERTHEFSGTLRKQVQKKSVFLRIQMPKPNHRGRVDERTRYTNGLKKYMPEDSLAYSARRVESKEREGSHMELDVSFKSNSLVAKEIVAPFSSRVVPGSSLTPAKRKIRTTMASDKVSKISEPTSTFKNRKLRLKCSEHKERKAFGSNMDFEQSKEKAKVSNVDNKDNSSSRTSMGTDVSIGMPEVKKSSQGTYLDRDGKSAGVSVDKCPLLKAGTKKKVMKTMLKKVNSHPSHLSKSQSIKNITESENACQYTPAAYELDKVVISSGEKIPSSGISFVVAADLKPTANEVTVLGGNEKKDIVIKDMAQIIPEDRKINREIVDSDESFGELSIMQNGEGEPNHSSTISTISNSNCVEEPIKQCCEKGESLMLGKGSFKQHVKVLLPVGGNISSGLSSSEVNDISKDRVTSKNIIQGLNTTQSFDYGICNSQRRCIVSKKSKGLAWTNPVSPDSDFVNTQENSHDADDGISRQPYKKEVNMSPKNPSIASQPIALIGCEEIMANTFIKREVLTSKLDLCSSIQTNMPIRSADVDCSAHGADATTSLFVKNSRVPAGTGSSRGCMDIGIVEPKLSFKSSIDVGSDATSLDIDEKTSPVLERSTGGSTDGSVRDVSKSDGPIIDQSMDLSCSVSKDLAIPGSLSIFAPCLGGEHTLTSVPAMVGNIVGKNEVLHFGDEYHGGQKRDRAVVDEVVTCGEIGKSIFPIEYEFSGLSQRLPGASAKNEATSVSEDVPLVVDGCGVAIDTPKHTVYSSTNLTKTRTWHRASSASGSPLAGNRALSNSFSPQEQIPKKSPVLQTSYIRKGNSLLRRPLDTLISSGSLGLTSSSVYQLQSSGVDELKNMKFGSRVDAMDPSNIMKAAINAHIERQRTLPLASIIKVPDHRINCLGECTSSPLEEPLASLRSIETDTSNSYEDALKVSETHVEPVNKLENHCEHSEVDLASKSEKKITYVKRKSNKLVATLEDCNLDKTQGHGHECYHKKRKNELVRTSINSHRKHTGSFIDDPMNPEGQPAPNNIASRTYPRQYNKVVKKPFKHSKWSSVWTPDGNHLSNMYGDSSPHQNVLRQLFPWKRATRRSFIQTSISRNSILSKLSSKHLMLRKRNTIYKISNHGYSLRSSKVLSVGGSNLNWSKSIHRDLKRANEDAALETGAVEKNQRDQYNTGSNALGTKSTHHSSRERIFRIASVRYKMDSSRRTLQRIPDDESTSTAPLVLETTKSYVPKRLVIDNDDYIRIGNGNQLIRDPKKRIRLLASEKVRRSLHTARSRLARKRKYCQFFTRFGKCNKNDGKCPYIHDPSKVSVCTKFLNGLCSDPDCKLTHKVIPERMPDCSYFLQGLCTDPSCPYRHVHVNPNTSSCEGFLRGYCTDGNECRKKHSYLCPVFEGTGSCPQGSKCKLHHPKKQSKERRKQQSRSRQSKNAQRHRYFGSSHTDVSSPEAMVIEQHIVRDTDLVDKLCDYISLGQSDKEAGDPTFVDSDPSDLQFDDLDELIKPIRIMNRAVFTT